MASSLEMPVATPVRTVSRWWWTASLAAAIIIYLVLSLWLAHTKAPWCDEGQYANSSYDLAFHGRMSTSVVEPSGYYLNAYFRGAQQRTYFIPPFQLVALAGWFRAFGPSAFSARVYSICWGVLTLLVLFYILQHLFPDRRVAPLATLFTAIDFVFLWSTADARMDAAASALALASLAAYLHFREKDFQKAVVVSQILGACAVFTHPNAVLAVLAIAVVAWGFDRDRLRIRCWRYLALAAAPYLLFGLLWSFYILQSPGDFSAQFMANAAGHNSERFLRIIRPDIAIGAEIVRHLTAYYLSSVWTGVMKGWMILIPFLYLPATIWFLGSWRRHAAPVRMFLVYAVAMVLGITFLDGFKGDFYLIYVIPIYASILAVWLVRLWSRSMGGKYVAAAVALAFVGLQLSISILHIRADEYHRDYERSRGGQEHSWDCRAGLRSRFQRFQG
jgi:4-amino-4-deoxy-L-arabinose transferase-like glycosyltransferase